MQQIEIKEEALPILKAGLTFQKELADRKTESYYNRLRNFEQKYNMQSNIFIKEFQAGNLGDDAHWFDWLFVYEAWKKTVEKKEIIESVSL